MAVGEAIGAKKGEEELKLVAKTSSDLATRLTQLELSTFAKVYFALDDTLKKDARSLNRTLAAMNDIYHSKNWNEQ